MPRTPARAGEIRGAERLALVARRSGDLPRLGQLAERNSRRKPRASVRGHAQLFQAGWGSAHGDAQQYLRVYVTHLRRKLEEKPYAPKYIVTEPGVGYRFESGGA